MYMLFAQSCWRYGLFQIQKKKCERLDSELKFNVILWDLIWIMINMFSYMWTNKKARQGIINFNVTVQSELETKFNRHFELP